jgi:hypothetical protein
MTALTADRNTEIKQLKRAMKYPVAASTTIYAGAMVAVNTSGYLVPAADTVGYRVVGLADEQVDNSSGSNGDLWCLVRTGLASFENDSTDAVAQVNIGHHVYVQDDNTVASAGNVVAGIAVQIDPDTSEIWVCFPDESNPISGGIETVTSGAISLYTRTSLISVTGTKAYTLADGLYEGQRKTLRCTVAASTPDGVLTPVTLADGTTITFDATTEWVELEWHKTGGWRIVGYYGATIA